MAQVALNVAIVASAESGHMNPMLLLAEGMAKRGHRVQVFTFAFGAGKYERRVLSFGGEFIGLPCDVAEEEQLAIAEKRNQIPMILTRDLMKPGLSAALAGKTLDIILADFATLAALEVAEEMKVPLVVNFPGPLKMAIQMLGAVDLTSMISFGGIHVSTTPFSMVRVAAMFNLAGVGILSDTLCKHMTKSLVLVNSFFGLEEAVPVPPHVTIIGPLAGQDENRKSLAETHPELHAFMADAVKAGKKVVYITTGTMVQLEAWMIQAIFNAMKLVGCRVIWSLKEDKQAFLPKRDDPSFFVSSWLPQPALLASDDLHAVVTHCGWGGTLECIAGAKPVIALPFFGDQPLNATLLVEAGAAELMGPVPGFSVKPSGLGCYKPGSITAETAAASVRRVLDDVKYLAAARRLKQLSVAYGLGCEHACRRIEAAARDGMDHVINRKLEERVTGHRPAVVTMVMLGLLAGVVAAGMRIKNMR